MITAVIGTRAQLIKMAPVFLELESHGISYNLLFTGQHRETMEKLLNDFDVATCPIYAYNGPEISGIARMLTWLPRVLYRLLRHRRRWLPRGAPGPDVILVHGDTFSTLLGALAGRLAGMRVAHVEAGLRSFNLLNPFPEEITRLLTFRLAHIAYAPGAWAAANLKHYHQLDVVNTGSNTLLDAVRLALTAPAAISYPKTTAYCVASIHRFENIFNTKRLSKIVDLLEEIAKQFPIVLVLHPTTRNRLCETGFLERFEQNINFHLVPRMGYIDFIGLTSKARFVITDGGSNQEELSYLGIPTLLMRSATERQEGIGDTAVLCNYDETVIDQFLQDLPSIKQHRCNLVQDSPSHHIATHLLALDDIKTREA